MSSQVSTLRGFALRPRHVLPTLCAVGVLCGSVAGQQQTPFKSGASTVAVYTTVTDSTRPAGTGPHQRRLRDLRQRQAPAAHPLCHRDAAHHRRRDARPQRQHEGELQSRRRGRRGVRQAAAAGRQGPHRQLRDQASRSIPRSSRAIARSSSTSCARSSSPKDRRRCGTPPTSRCGSSRRWMGARSSCSSPTASTRPGTSRRTT